MGPRDGDAAPDFALDGVPPGAGPYRLSEQRGKVVVLAFYPGDFTPVCLRQLTHYEEQRQRLVATGATLWAISTDLLEKHERMAKSYALSFPLLSDPDGQVAELYGVRSLMGTARRSLFLIDEEGVVRYRREEPLSLSYRSVDDILTALRESGLLSGAQAEAAAVDGPDGDGGDGDGTEGDGQPSGGGPPAQSRSAASETEAGRPASEATSSRP